jgi:hypothetical protein
MVEGTIDADTLRRLFADLSAATILAVREKGVETVYASAEEMSPDVASHRLLSGVARAVQVRYQFDGCEWTDTILAVRGGFRVVRCRFDPAS